MREAFERIIESHPEDTLVRSVFADWLDENTDEAEYATFLRSWTLEKYREAQAWFNEFAKTHGGSGYTDDPDDDYEPTTPEFLIQCGYDSLDTYRKEVAAGSRYRDGYVWTQRGREDLRDFMYTKDGNRTFWQHWSIITSTPLRVEEYEDNIVPFGCSC